MSSTLPTFDGSVYYRVYYLASGMMPQYLSKLGGLTTHAHEAETFRDADKLAEALELIRSWGFTPSMTLSDEQP